MPHAWRTPGSIMVFVNIDWKDSRHDTAKSVEKNMKVIKKTVHSIVDTHKPAVICFCEAGEAGNPLTDQHMRALIKWIVDTWQELLQSAQLEWSFKIGYPYLTVWDASQAACFNFRVTCVYEFEPKHFAQLFAMITAGVETDAVNIHLASGTVKLKDPVRQAALVNLIRKPSAFDVNTNIGRRRCIIGGDMNTSPQRMSTIFSVLKEMRLLQSHAMPEFIIPPHGKHGDLVVTTDPDVTGALGKGEKPRSGSCARRCPNGPLSRFISDQGGPIGAILPADSPSSAQ
jgi:hypothetical protein